MTALDYTGAVVILVVLVTVMAQRIARMGK